MLINLKKIIPQLTLMGLMLMGIYETGFCQEPDMNKYKIWNANDSLCWSDYVFSDFNQSLKYGIQAKAVTSLVHIYVPGIWHIDSCMNIVVALRKRYSFTQDTTDTRLLEHERIHFDIAEMFARYLRKEFLELSKSNENSLDQYLSLRDSLFKEASSFQDFYDSETVYGLNLKEQRVWTLQIKKELEEWKEYSFENISQLCNSSLADNKSK